MDPSFESSNAKLVDTVGFVLEFLRNVGLDKAEAALINEISEKYPDLGASPSDPEEEDGYASHADTATDPETSQEPER